MPEIQTLPTHVGIILDGNRRWAKANNAPTLEGHRQGAEVFKKIALYGFEKGVKYISAYVFSTENWSRTEEEVGYLMKLVTKAVENYLKQFQEKGIRVIVLGRREGLNGSVLKAIDKAENSTKGNSKGTLALCFNYGGREEIADAVNKIVAQKKAITPDTIGNFLYEPAIPDIDLVIRTSGEQRLSGFMQWRAQYAELYFTELLWPDFSTKDFDEAVKEYSNRQRRFGK